jgi:phosphomannomutase/phosphoglucomutase
MNYNKSIFREYDIRGIVDKDYDHNFAELLGRAYGHFLKSRVTQRTRPLKVAIGRDVRLTGERLFNSLAKGVQSQGIDVVYLGQVPTPVVYYTTFTQDIDGAICVTGSHNPAEYNGFKICVGKGTLHGKDIQELRRIIESGEAETSSGQLPIGKRSEWSPLENYKQYVSGQFRLSRPLKVVVDPANACGALIAPELLRAIGCNVIPLYCDVDGKFPNHHPDPTVEENLADLKKKVLETKADLGIAYDGDADRIGAVDELGQTVFGDELLLIFARDILKRKPGATIIGEVKCSNRLYKDISKNGGKPLMWKTGHSLIKSKMKESKAELAGEMSGHIFFADGYFGYDDAIYASVRLLDILDRARCKLSELLIDLPKVVNTPEIRLDCPDEIKFDVVEKVKEILAQKYEVIAIDGVRVETPNGWGLLRASNTQPVVVMRFEATSQAHLDSLRREIESTFEKVLGHT